MKRHSKRKRHSCQQKNIKANQEEYFQLTLAHIDIEKMLRENLHAFAAEFALVLVRELLEEELCERCSSRYERSVDRTACRHGRQPGDMRLPAARQGCWRLSVKCEAFCNSGESGDTGNSPSWSPPSVQPSPEEALPQRSMLLKMKTKGILFNFNYIRDPLSCNTLLVTYFEYVILVRLKAV